MQKKITALICFCLLMVMTISITVSAQSDSARAGADRCQVYVVDVKAVQDSDAQADIFTLMKRPKVEQDTLTKGVGVKIYQEFFPLVAEERLTTKTFPFPVGKQVIIASIFYTDESMASNGHSDSIVMAIGVSPTAGSDAFLMTNAAVAEISYDDHFGTARVKRKVIFRNRLYQVGLECRHQKPEPRER